MTRFHVKSSVPLITQSELNMYFLKVYQAFTEAEGGECTRALKMGSKIGLQKGGGDLRADQSPEHLPEF